MLLYPERLSLIAKAGQDLIKSRYLMNQRSELLDWFHGKITKNELRHSSEASRLDVMMRRLDELIAQEELEIAERFCNEWTTSVNWAPGLVVRHVFVKLLQGSPYEAINIITPLIVNRFNLGSEQPDPIQWATLLMCVFLNRDFESVRENISIYPNMTRTELDVVRWVLAVALDEKQLAASFVEKLLSDERQTQTIHNFGSVSIEKTLKVIDLILKRCNMGSISGYIWEQARLQGILRTQENTIHKNNERITA